MAEPSGGRLAGRVAVITGGASGMGRATAERFLVEGARVVVGDLNGAHGEAWFAARAAAGDAARLRFVRADVSQEADVAALVEAALREFGRLDVMFNNAAIGGAFGPLTETEVRAWDETFEVDVRSVFLGIKHAARAMIAAGRGGAIVNTASIAGLSGGGGAQAYSAAKAAVINLTQSAAVELAPQRIRVNAICPGAIYTPLMHGGKPEAADTWRRELQPWPERGEPEDIAGAALFLSSDDARFVTGAQLLVDGGLTAAGPRLTQSAPMFQGLAKLSGIAYGTTGKRPRYRRLED
jgi:NAD(P)-dependent dehydrogenase (short-subunit alcohol dehydrogenase family)